MKNLLLSRRNFLGKAATAGAAGFIVPAIITSCSRSTKRNSDLPAMLDQAPDGPVLKAGLDRLRRPRNRRCNKLP